MSGIALTTPVSRGQDANTDILFIGINYDQSKVIVRLRFNPSGATRDFTFEGASLIALRNALTQFSGLRTAMLSYLQTLDSTLGGNVT